MSNDIQSPERQFLDKLIKERAELDQLINLVQKRLGLSENSGVEPTVTPGIQSPDSSEVLVQKGEFFGMSRPQAVAILLDRAKHPMSTKELVELLVQSEMEGMSSKNVFSSLYTSLIRSSELIRVARNRWGLARWYPHLKQTPAKKRNASNEPSSGTPIEELPPSDDQE